MAKIDELVLSLKFDNSKFKSAAQDTLSMLDRLKSSLKIGGVQDAFKGSALGAEDLGKAVKNVDMSKLSGDVSEIRDKFSVMGVVGGTAIAKLTSSAMDLGAKLTSAITQPLVQGGMNRAKNIEQARFMLQGLGADVAAVEKAAMNSVEGTAYGFDQAARAASQFYASGVTDMKAMEKALLGISGATAMTGASYDDISQIFTTVSGQGRVLSEQLNQFASRGLNVAATLAKHFKVSEGELRDMVSKNKVSFEDFYEAMSAAYGEHAKKAGETFEGAMANAKAPLSRIGADVASVYLKQMTGLFNAIKPFLDVVHGALEPIIDFINKMQESRIGGLTKMLNSLTEGLQKGGGKEPAILGWIGDIGESVAHLMEQVSKIGGAIGKAFSNQFLGQWKGLRAFVDGAAASILKFVKTIQISDRFLLNVTRTFDAVFAAVRFGLQIFKSFAGALLAIGDAVFRYIIPPLSDFIGYIGAAVAALLRFVTGTKAVEGGVGGLTWVIVNIIKVIGKFLSAITWAIDKVIEFFGALAKGKVFSEDSFPAKAVKAFGDAVKGVAKVLGSLKAPAVESLKSAFELLKTVVVETGRTIATFFGNLDFSWLTNLFSGFSNLNIGNPFKDFKVPSLDLSKATESVKNFGESLRNSIQTGDLGDKITAPFKSAFEYIRNINWSGVMDGLKNALSNIGEFVSKSFTNVKDFVGNVNWAELGSNIVDKLVTGLTAAKDFAAKVGKFLVDAFKSAVDSVDFGAIWNGMKDFGSNVKDKIAGMFDGVDEKVDNVKGKLETDLNTTANIELAVDSTEIEKPATKSKLKQIADGIGEALKGMSSKSFDAGKIRDAFGESLSAGLAGFSATWGKFITSLTNMFNLITDPIGTAFANAKASITKGFGDLGKATMTAGNKFGDSLLNILSDKRLNEFAKTLSGLIGALGVFQMGQGIKSIGGAFESLGGFFDGLSESIAGFADAAKMKARTDGIFKIAAAIGILAASLWVLSKIDVGGLTKGVVTITALLAVLFGFLFAMDKFKLTSTIGLQLLLISSSIGILVLSIMALSKLDFDSVVNGVKNVGVALIGLGVALGIFGKGVQQLRSGKLLALAASMVVMAAAVYVLATAAERLAALSVGQLATVGVSIAAFVGGLMLAANLVTPKSLVGLAALGATMLGVSASLLLISIAAERLGAMDFGSLSRAGIAIGALMAALTVMTTYMKPQDAIEMMALGGTMLMVAGAVLVLAISAQRIATIPKDDLIVAAGTIAALFIAVSIMANAFPTTKTASIMASVMSISVMLTVLVAALFVLSSMDWNSLAKGIVGIVGVSAALFVLLLGLSKVVNAAESLKLNALIPIILTLTLAFAAITAMVYVLDGVEWSALGKGAVALLMFVVTLAAVAAIGAVAAPLVGPIAALLLSFSVSLAIAAVGIGFGAKLFAEAMSILVDAFDRFIETIRKISDNSGAVLEGANVLKEIAATGKLDLAGFGLAIGTMLMGMKNADRLDEFVNSMRKLSDNSEAIKTGAQTLKDIADHGKMDLTLFGGAIGSLLTGMNNIENLDPFINSMKKLGENSESITNGVNALKSMAETGKMDLTLFGGALASFMGSMGDNVYNLDPFISAMKSMGENSEAVMAGVNTLKSLRGDWGWDEMRDFGKSFKALSDNMDNGQNMWFLINPMKDLGNNAEVVLRGVNTLKSFGGDIDLSGLYKFGSAFKGLSDQMDNGQNMWFLINPMKDLGNNVEAVTAGINALKSFGQGIDTGALSNFGNAFKSLSDNMANAGNIDGFVNSMTSLSEKSESIRSGVDSLRNLDVSGLSEKAQEIKSAFDNLGTTLGEGLKLPDVSGKIREFIDSIGNAARAGHGQIKSAFYYAFGGSVDGINAQKPHVTSAAKNAMSAGAQGAKGAHGAFFSAGYYAGGGMVDGLEAQRGNIMAKATSIASSAAAAAKAALKVHSPSRVFMEIGRYTALGLAAGIERNAGVSTNASTDMASGVIGAATSALEIHSPSKVFTRVGKNVNEGMAKGIKDNAHKPRKEMGKTLDGVIKETHSKSKDAAKAGDTFADSLINGINNNPATRRLEALMKHSKALYATKVKEKKIKDAEERERKEDEREQIYRDVRESRQGIADAKRDAADAKQEIKDSKHDRAKQKKEVAKNKKAAKKTKQDAHDVAKQNRASARKVQDSERKYKDSQQKIRDAEKKYRRSLSKKERYEYEQYGSEAGVAFVDGVAVGLIDESDKLPTLHEVMRDVLYEELDKVKKEANDFMGIFDGIQDLRGAFGKLKDNTNELRRAFTRMSHAANPRSFLRNAGHVFDAVVNIGKEVVGLMDILDKFKPFLPGLLAGFENMLPAITPAIAQFAPGLAAQLGGGLTTALPAIAGPAAAIVAAVVGIGYLIYDSGTEKVILKFFRSIVDGIAKLVSNLPQLLANFMKIMITGLKNVIVELPRMAADLIKGVLNGLIDVIRALPDLIPEVIIALIDAFVEIVVTMPEIFVDLAFAIIEALFKAIFVVLPEFFKRIPEMFKRIGEAIVDGVVQGIGGGFRRLGESIRNTGRNMIDGFKKVFGIRSPSRVMAEMGGYLVDGLQKGIEGGENKVVKATDVISDKIRNSVQDAIDSLDDDSAFRLNITPVVDLAEAHAGLSRLEAKAGLVASQTASTASSVRLDNGNVDPAKMGNVTNITYTQNNTSPKPLSTIEIYRQTERQLANMR